jgi:tetratricopeptide (TPR) repeat protein
MTKVLLGLGVFLFVGAATACWSICLIQGARALSQARRLAASSLPEAGALSAEAYNRAAAHNPLDPTPHAEQAGAMLRIAEAGSLSPSLVEAERAIENAIERDPYSLGLRRLKLRILLTQARQSRHPWDFAQAVAAAREALALYPFDPVGLINLGDVLSEAANAESDDPEKKINLLLPALEAWQIALELDNSRPAWEVFHRLTPTEKQAVEARVARARGQVTE